MSQEDPLPFANFNGQINRGDETAKFEDFYHLPKEMQFLVFTFLKIEDLVICSKVCKEWNTLTKSKILWSSFYKVRTSNRPPPRVCHLAFIFENKLYVCGGHTPTVENAFIKEVLNDIWSLDLVGENAFKDWKTVTTYGENFPRLTESNGALHDGKWYFFGGFTTDSGLTRRNNIFCLDLRTFKLDIFGAPLNSSPRGRSVHSLILYEGSLYIFGGWDTNKTFNDFWNFSIQSKQFTKLGNIIEGSTKELPATRYPVAVVYKESMYMTTGYSAGESHVTQLFEYHFPTSIWREISTKGKSPPIRSRSRGFVHNDSLYIVGGYNMTTRTTYADMYKLDLKKFEWSEVRVGSIPQICQHVCVVNESEKKEDGSDILYIFGGFSDKATNNLYALRLFE